MNTEIAFWPEAATTTAVAFDHLFLFVFVVCMAVGLLVAALLFYFCIRYRRRPGEIGPAPEIREPRWLEWFWTISPIGFFAVFFLWGAKVYFDAFRAPDDATPIYVVGKQWMWKFQHPEGQREIDVLHVPAGRPIKLIMTSEDVIHSLFVPEFRIHMDLLPERYTSTWFEAIRPGRYRLFCTEYCGTQHSGMIGEIVVMEPDEFQKWIESSPEGSLAMQGRKEFLKYRCLSCHSADENARGPVLEDLFDRPVRLADGRTVTADENYLRQSILYPSAAVVAGWENIMPTFKGQISEEEIIAIIAYIRSLEAGQTPPRVEHYPPPTATPPVNTKEESP